MNKWGESIVCRVYSIILLFFLLLSNLSFGLTNMFIFLQEQDISNISNVDLYNQYKAFSLMPKNFVNMCIKINDELQMFNPLNDKVQNIVNDNKNKFCDTNVALIGSVFKLKVLKVLNYPCFFQQISVFKQIILSLIFIVFIYYLITYIGLLYMFKGFNYYYLYNKKLCL